MDSLMQMPKYEVYKDSGVEWLGRLPSKWGIKKLKYLGVIYAGLGGKKGDDFSKEYKDGFSPFIPFTSISNSSIVANRFQFVSVKPSEVQVQVENNDILFLMSSETLEDIAKCALYRGEIQPLYLNSFCKGFRIRSANAQPDFINHLLQSDYYREYFAISARGFTRINLKQEFINNAPMALPSLAEQTAIAAFLDRKTEKIDQAVAIKEKQIALLKERKQILIQNAVTRSLDPNVPMKDSGVEWIGEIPAHWKFFKLGSILKSVSIKNQPHRPLLSITRERGVIVRNIDDQEENHNYIPDDLTNYKMIEKGQFGMNKMKAWQGSYGVSDYTGIVSPAYYIFSFLKSFYPPFFHFAIRSKLYVSFFGKASDGVRIGQWDLSKTRMKEIPFVLPPYDEQVEIVAKINSESDKADNAITLQQQQIEKLKEYKTTLINSAVTGKTKVA